MENGRGIFPISCVTAFYVHNGKEVCEISGQIIERYEL